MRGRECATSIGQDAVGESAVEVVIARDNCQRETMLFKLSLRRFVVCLMAVAAGFLALIPVAGLCRM